MSIVAGSEYVTAGTRVRHIILRRYGTVIGSGYVRGTVYVHFDRYDVGEYSVVNVKNLEILNTELIVRPR